MVIKSRAIFDPGDGFGDNGTWEGLQKCYWRADSQFCPCVSPHWERTCWWEQSLSPPHQEKFYAEKSLHYLISPAFLWFWGMNFSSRRKREDEKAAVVAHEWARCEPCVCRMVAVASSPMWDVGRGHPRVLVTQPYPWQHTLWSPRKRSFRLHHLEHWKMVSLPGTQFYSHCVF